MKTMVGCYQWLFDYQKVPICVNSSIQCLQCEGLWVLLELYLWVTQSFSLTFSCQVPIDVSHIDVDTVYVSYAPFRLNDININVGK